LRKNLFFRKGREARKLQILCAAVSVIFTPIAIILCKGLQSVASTGRRFVAKIWYWLGRNLVGKSGQRWFARTLCWKRGEHLIFFA
jgi:hypothetical protein